MTEANALNLVRATGAALAVLAVVLLLVMPKAPVRANVPGFESPVIGFELASTAEHVFGILGRPEDRARAAAVRAMDLTNRIDFLFMIAYPAFFVAIACLLTARGAAPLALIRATALLAVAMAVADALENRQLLVLSQSIDPIQMAEPLRILRVFTVIKWTALFVTSGLVAVFVGRRASGFRWSAPIFALAALLGAFALHAASWLEPAANVLAVAWLATLVHALRSRAPA